MLAGGPYSVNVDGEALVLRPTLRAALRLERAHGLPALYRGVLEGNLSIVADMIAECSERPTYLPTLLNECGRRGARKVQELQPSLLELLSDLALVGDDEQDKPASSPHARTAKTITREQFYADLFAFATGNLGWTPADAWISTPAEILAAQKGRRDLLVSIFGSGDKPAETKPQGPLSDQAADAMLTLGGKRVKRPKKDFLHDA